MLAFVDWVHFENGVEAPPTEKTASILSYGRAYDHRSAFIENEVTTPKNFDDVTTPTENSRLHHQ